MKRAYLGRYDRASDGTILIDVTAGKVEDLYNNFDRIAPYIRRDLEPDLVDYLIDCAKELGDEPFAIRFTLANPPDEGDLERVRRSVQVFFGYLAELERQKIHEMFRKSLTLLSVGIGILFVSVKVNQSLGTERTMLANVFAEGLTVAAWVALWEALSTFLVEWFPQRKNIRRYRRLSKVHLIFQPEPTTRSVAGNGL